MTTAAGSGFLTPDDIEKDKEIADKVIKIKMNFFFIDK